MWYSKSYRRHLCDMHIDDWGEDFLSEFNPEEYYANLKRAKVNNAMLYFQSHVGLCYYPTRVGRMHNAFRGRENAMRILVDKCRKNGISVTGYYSLIYNNWAHDAHPEWRMVRQDGQSARAASERVESTFAESTVCRYGLCCPNNLEYRDFVEEQIKEMSEFFSFDGMFFDMLFWLHPCYCPECRKRWKREVGGELPEVEDWSDYRWQLHMEKRRQWMGEFAQFATDTLKKYAPHASVEHNLASIGEPDRYRGNAEEVLLASDFAGGDLYGGPYNHSFICKLYRNISPNRPFEYMSTRCTPTLAKHTTSKSEDVLCSEVSLTAAHHGATLLIDAIDPVGTLDRRVYELFGRIMDKQIPYEQFFEGNMVEDIGLYYSLRSKFNAHGEAYDNHSSCVRMVETLVGEHMSFGVTGSLHDFSGYQVLVAPMLTLWDEKDYSRIIEYVHNGGQLYLSGSDCEELLNTFFSSKVTGRTEHKVVYIAPTERAGTSFGMFNEKYPLHVDGTAPILSGISPENVIATIKLPYTKQELTQFASIHSDPPGILTEIPAVAVADYGKGRVLWSAMPIEGIDNYNHSQVFLSLLNAFFCIRPSFTSDAFCDVEITEFIDDNAIYLHAVHLNSARKARKIEPFSVSIWCKEKPNTILCLPEQTPVAFQWEAGYAKFKILNLDFLAMYKIIL